jgi:hypothetical protein
LRNASRCVLPIASDSFRMGILLSFMGYSSLTS